MRLALAVATVSAAVLAYEVILVRLFAIVQWHHFAYMIISIALLGFGASGTFLALARRRLVPRFEISFAANAAGFGVTALGGFVVAQHLPFNPLEIVWSPAQLFYLLALYALFAVPFFCGANCIGLALICHGQRIGGLYGANLIGSGVGALAIVGVLFLAAPGDSLRLAVGLGIAAGVLVLRRRGAVLVLLAIALPLGVPSSWTAPRLSPYKALSQALTLPGAEIVGGSSSPIGWLRVVRSPTVPFRHVPGLSLTSPVEPPAQLAVFTDGEGMTAITAFDGDRDTLGYLDHTTSALPYHLVARPRVLVLGAGGGAAVLQALFHEAAHVDAVELDPAVVRLVAQEHAAFAGELYDRTEVAVHVAEARAFVARSDERWDVIQIPLLDSFAAAAAGVASLSESHVYTVEALRGYVRHLEPGGILAITRWLKLPPRDSLKLFATALAALEAEGMAGAERLALLRSWNTTTLVVKYGPIDARDAAVIRAFAAARVFDVAYLPGLDRSETNRANVLDAPHVYDGAMALSGADRADFIRRYKFDIAPTRDDRPYFFDFFRWRTLPELLALGPPGMAALAEWGYLILVATLAQAAMLSVAVIVLPLWRRGPAGERWRVAGYFAALGLAFLFVEIAFIQRFVLFLGHPLYAVAVVLFAMLVFAGVGSRTSAPLAAWVEKRGAKTSAIDLAVLAIAVVALVYLLALPPLFDWLMPLADTAKVAVAIALIAPLAFAMGLPFPLGLSRVSRAVPALVPWAWGVNGCASVISAVLAIHLGFAAVVAAAIVLYGVAALLFRTPLVAGEGRI